MERRPNLPEPSWPNATPPHVRVQVSTWGPKRPGSRPSAHTRPEHPKVLASLTTQQHLPHAPEVTPSPSEHERAAAHLPPPRREGSGRERVIVPVCLCWLGPLLRPPETHILCSQEASLVTCWGGHFAIIHCGGGFFHERCWPLPMDQRGRGGPGHPSTEQQPGWPLPNGTARSVTRGQQG